MSHSLPVRVYYEDTDMGGIVYYANYLKYIERGRSVWVQDIGVDQMALRDAGYVFAVRRVEADYKAPARLDDLLTVETSVHSVSGARLVMDQKVLRGDTVLFSAIVTVVCLTVTGAPARLPEEVRRLG
jgi:acyl-CoA thioester hydrolase